MIPSFNAENAITSDTTCPLQEFQNNLLQEEAYLSLTEFLKSFLILCFKPASSNKAECHLKPRAQVNILPMFISFSTLPAPHSPQSPEHHYKPTSTISSRVSRTKRKEASKCVSTSNQRCLSSEVSSIVFSCSCRILAFSDTHPHYY